MPGRRSCYNLSMTLLRRYRAYDLPAARHQVLLETARHHLGSEVGIDTEYCFYVETARDLEPEKLRVLDWLLTETFEPQFFGPVSFLDGHEGTVLEVGPRMSFTTAWSTNAVSVCHACGLSAVQRIERSRRYLLRFRGAPAEEARVAFLARVHDRMTECPYPEPLTSFATGVRPAPVSVVPVMAEGRAALERINRELGLAFDDWDLDFYTDLFRDRLGRNPTDVECFDI
ncbi:MAG: phosphoribosylformylglycinamidine synthase, partial [Acidobacteria bacterium]|nr:phosphoribosylformylglycinamidine synthase [Acidobacteriota bacterium]